MLAVPIISGYDGMSSGWDDSQQPGTGPREHSPRDHCMPPAQFVPEDDVRRPPAHHKPNLTGDETGLSRVHVALQRRGPKGAAGAPLTQAGAPAPSVHIVPTVAYGTSVRSRAASPTTTREDNTTMRRITRTIQHLIAGSLSSQKVARANAASASVTLKARREDREGVDDYLAAHHSTRAQAAARHSSAETTTRGRTDGWAGPTSPGEENLPGERPQVNTPHTGEQTVADMWPQDLPAEVGP